MNGRDLIRNIIAGKPGPRCGFWLGNPHFETWPILHKYFGTRTEEELRRKLGDDYRWISPQFVEPEFLPPADGRSFGFAKPKLSHGQAGPLADVEDPAELDRFDWPDPEILDFERTIGALEAAGPHYRASGFWCPFFHDVMDLFGMEGYFVKMTTNPTIVRAVTQSSTKGATTFVVGDSDLIIVGLIAAIVIVIGVIALRRHRHAPYVPPPPPTAGGPTVATTGFCVSCGAPLKPGVKFCGSCDERIE